MLRATFFPGDSDTQYGGRQVGVDAYVPSASPWQIAAGQAPASPAATRASHTPLYSPAPSPARSLAAPLSPSALHGPGSPARPPPAAQAPTPPFSSPLRPLAPPSPSTSYSPASPLLAQRSLDAEVLHPQHSHPLTSSWSQPLNQLQRRTVSLGPGGSHRWPGDALPQPPASRAYVPSSLSPGGGMQVFGSPGVKAQGFGSHTSPPSATPPFARRRRGTAGLSRQMRTALAAAAAAVLVLSGAFFCWLWARGSPISSSRLFTSAELSRFDGIRSSRIYTAVLGQVFDVTAGARFYGPRATYAAMAGKDASRALITGDFRRDARDEVADMPLPLMHDLFAWLAYYEGHLEYPCVGKVVGAFYDRQGRPTPHLKRCEDLSEKTITDEGVWEGAPFEPCHTEWTVQGGRSKAGGGGGRGSSWLQPHFGRGGVELALVAFWGKESRA